MREPSGRATPMYYAPKGTVRSSYPLRNYQSPTYVIHRRNLARCRGMRTARIGIRDFRYNLQPTIQCHQESLVEVPLRKLLNVEARARTETSGCDSS